MNASVMTAQMQSTAAVLRATGLTWPMVSERLAEQYGLVISAEALRNRRYKRRNFREQIDAAVAEFEQEGVARALAVVAEELEGGQRLQAADIILRHRAAMSRASRSAEVEVTPTRIVVSFGAPAVADQEADDGAE